MTNNFIDDGLVSATGLPLPSSKENNPLAPILPSLTSVDADDFNTVTGALADIKVVIVRTASIMSYGADNTGATDSSAAFTAAFAALAATGGILLLPSGEYEVAAVVTCPAGVIMRGEGQLATVLNFSGSGQLILRGGSSIGAPESALEDVQVTTSNSPSAAAVLLGDPAGASEGINIRVSRVNFNACAAGAITSVNFLNDVTVDGCYLHGCCAGISTPVALLQTGSSTTMLVRKCYFSNNNNTSAGVALKVIALDFANIENCAFESSGLLLSASGGSGAKITGCYFEDAQNGFIYSSYTFGLGVLSIRDCFFNKGASATGIVIESVTNQAVIIEGCSFGGGFSVASGDFLFLQCATLGSIRLACNSTSSTDFGALIGCDDSHTYGDVGSYTNNCLHSSFEDASHVSSTGNLTASQQTGMANATGGTTSQKLVWTSNATVAIANFVNAELTTTTGDTTTISFYAKAAAAVQAIAQVAGTEPQGMFAINLTTAWKRYIIQSATPTVSVDATEGLWLSVPANTAATIYVDGVQVEKLSSAPPSNYDIGSRDRLQREHSGHMSQPNNYIDNGSIMSYGAGSPGTWKTFGAISA